MFTLGDLETELEAIDRTRPDLAEIRSYNHYVFDVLASLRTVVGKRLLDVGASPYGYLLERALSRGVAEYVGVTLDYPVAKEVEFEGRSGRLLEMNAERLELESASFDLLLSISTFEHFADGRRALSEMFRVLAPGGSALVNFQPVWTSSQGHHLHHFTKISGLIPPWAHLVWTDSSMRDALRESWPDDAELGLEDAVRWVFRGDEINRVDAARQRQLFEESDFEIEWLVPLKDDETGEKPVIARYLSRILPYSAEDLMTLGYSILLNKPA